MIALPPHPAVIAHRPERLRHKATSALVSWLYPLIILISTCVLFFTAAPWALADTYTDTRTVGSDTTYSGKVTAPTDNFESPGFSTPVYSGGKAFARLIRYSTKPLRCAGLFLLPGNLQANTFLKIQ